MRLVIRWFDNKKEIKKICKMDNFSAAGSQAETLPTLYGLMIAFLTGLVGYVLWVSLMTLVYIYHAVCLPISSQFIIFRFSINETG